MLCDNFGTSSFTANTFGSESRFTKILSIDSDLYSFEDSFFSYTFFSLPASAFKLSLFELSIASVALYYAVRSSGVIFFRSALFLDNNFSNLFSLSLSSFLKSH